MNNFYSCFVQSPIKIKLFFQMKYAGNFIIGYKIKYFPVPTHFSLSHHKLYSIYPTYRQTRRLRDYELQHDRQLLLSIMKTWKDIKALRDAEDCTNTPVKLGVRK